MAISRLASAGLLACCVYAVAFSPSLGAAVTADSDWRDDAPRGLKHAAQMPDEVVHGPAKAGVAIAATEPEVPSISEAHRRFLSRVARRTLRNAALGRDTYQPGYVPAALSSLTAEAVVRIRHGGYLIAVGVGKPSAIAISTRDAAATAASTLADAATLDVDQVRRWLVEIEVLGPPVVFRYDGDWTQPGALDAFVEPGVHGVTVHGPRGHRSFCPSELFTSGITVAEALARLAKHTHGASSQLPQVGLKRFRTAHWVQPAGSDDIVSLTRGLTLVPPTAVSPRGLDDAISRLAEYMTYRQRDTGLFAYQYEAGNDRYSPRDNPVRQAGATMAMARHAAFSGKSASLAAADIGIRHHLLGLTPIPELDDAAFIATPDGKHKLGVTALLCLAMSCHPHADRYDETRRKLVHGMLWLQRPSGMFITAFPPAEAISAQDYFPGEALLALAGEYAREPSARILEAFSRSIDFYRARFRRNPAPALVPWQVQAYAKMAGFSKRKDYADFVYELTDWLVERQLTASNCAWPELWGGIAATRPGHAGADTAAFLEALTEAQELAASRGDEARARRYEASIRSAARFVMQLQMRPEEAYFIISPTDAVGGIRRTLTLNVFRINDSQHALIALMKTRETLFPDGE